MTPTDQPAGTRLTAVPLLLVFGASALALFGLLYWLTSAYLVHEVDARLFREEKQLLHGSRAELIARVDALGKRPVARVRPYGLFDPDGTWLAGNIKRPPPSENWKPFNYTLTRPKERKMWVAHFRGIAAPAPTGERLVVGQSIDETLQFDRMLLTTVACGLVLAMLLGLGCAAALNAASNRRIREISRTSWEIRAGQLGRRLPVHGARNDLDRLALIVNAMLDDIERLVSEVRGVCAGIAHDLRTPMTHLRAGLERVRRHSNDAASYGSAIDTAIVQADVVLSRFSGLLRIAEIEAGERRASFREIEFGPVLQDVVDLYVPVAEERRIVMTVQIRESVQIMADVDLLFGAIENLIDNALKFTPAGGAVAVELELCDEVPTLRISDTGPGIDPDERESVLKPFYRSSRYAGQSTSGHGLGLSLVAAIARVHDAEIDIQDGHPGCQVILRFGTQQASCLAPG